jgi:hypothetical protein
MAFAAHRASDQGASGDRRRLPENLKAAGIGVRPPRAWGRRPPAKPANEVTTHSATLIYNQLALSHFSNITAGSEDSCRRL